MPGSAALRNPASLAFLLRREIARQDAALYVAAQILGGLAGMFAAHAMVDLPLLQISEVVATSAWWPRSRPLATMRSRPEAVGYMVGLYITAGYWFTASTSFANPAVTVARSFTGSFSGIVPVDAPGFILARLLGAVTAAAVFAWLLSPSPQPRHSLSDTLE